MEKVLQPAGLQTTARQTLYLLIDADTFTLEGNWEIIPDQQHAINPDFHTLPLSFNYIVSIDRVNNLIYPDDIYSVKFFINELQEKKDVRFNFRFITAGGHIHSLSGSGTLTRINNRDTFSNLRSLFDTIDEGFCIVEVISHDQIADYKFLECNPAFVRLTGLSHAIGNTFRQLIGDPQDQTAEVYSEVARTRRPIRFNYKVDRNGERWYEVSAFPTGEPGGNLVGVMFSDVSDRRKTEQDLKEMNIRLREMDKAKTAFFTNASHEFRTPLTLLTGPIEDLIKNASGHLSIEELQKLQLSLRNGMRLQKLVNTMLDFVKTEAGKIEAFYQPTDIVKLTTDIASNFRSLIENAGLKYLVKCQEVDSPVYLNRDMYEKILLNLISNAFKFTLEGKIEVSIRARKKYILLSVKDTGVGIASSDTQRIFEKFVRIDRSKARTYEGTGIGLALVKDLVALHGGTISVESEDGKGSEFIVSIPRGKSHLPAKQIFESKEKLPTSEVTAAYVEEAASWRPVPGRSPVLTSRSDKKIKRPRVIIADDNADMRDYLVTILGGDCQVINVEHGQKVIELLSAGATADLIVADVMMPVMGGLEMITLLRRDPKTANIPVILLSGHGGEESKINGLQHGADDYLCKPFSAEELKALVQSRLKSSKAHAETFLRAIEMEKQVIERTEQLRKSETLIKKQNADLRNILNAIPQMVWVLDAECRIKFVNERWYTYTGLTETQCHALNARTCDIFHPSQEKEIGAKWNFLFSKLKRYVGETMIRSHTREYRWHLDITEPIFNDAGELEMWVGTFTDVHEQFISERESRETKDLLQAVFDASSNAIIAHDSIYDDDGRAIDFKARYFNKKILEYFSEADLASKTLRELLKEYDATPLYENLKAVVETGIPFETDYKTQRLEAERWVHIKAIKLGDGLVITQHDITDQVETRQRLMELNASLKQKNYELKSMNDELTNFAFVSSHDLREPLRKIQLFTSGILSRDQDKLSESSIGYAQKIITAVGRVNDLIEDILTYSKLSSYTRREPVITDLNELLEQVLSDLHETIHSKNAKIISNKLPSFKCNPLQMIQLIHNMISNGLTFQPNERVPEINVAGQIIPGETIDSPLANAALNYLKLEITDNGIGIEEQYLERIFGIFQRLHSGEMYPGTGIGLAICKKIVENHNGFIHAKSIVGSGSTFCCYLPVS